MVRLVTLSAAYGAGGSEIGPLLAQRLGVPFVDRAIPLAVAERLEVPVDVAQSHDEEISPSLLVRVLQGFIAADSGAPMPPVPELVSDQEFRRATEETLRRQAQTGEGVILGRGGACVLADRDDVLRVRLYGPPQRRCRRAMQLQGLDERTARRGLERNDRAHAAYIRHNYGADIDDPALYHLMFDATALEIEHCVDVILLMAQRLAVGG
jgi:cytidylate kinase